MPDVRIESVGDDKYFIWINGVKQSGTHTLDQCMTMISTAEEMEQKEKGRGNNPPPLFIFCPAAPRILPGCKRPPGAAKGFPRS